ncbi:hypothetical protein L6452_20826 [Arctium lappa]|uniref:Uncharacterized protein n=1 Tax=Arctium lappa TaxID=4217 RepID=A0ACB9BGW7_ARCLA|nr:hypothetical protein L6452_20826 [Arctium lappa]
MQQFPVAYRRRFQVDSEDIISRMPENVITNVLDRLPLQVAVRTSILSRNWRCCPLLENLEISSNTQDGKVKLGDIAKLVNLKMFSLKLEMLGDYVVTSSDILQLVGSLPKLEKLKLNFRGCMMLAKAGARETLLANLHCLKMLALKKIDFKDHIMLECAYDLINGLPNLQTLKMTHATSSPDYLKVPCSIKGNLQLQYVDFGCLCCEENEVCFIESVLAYSPLLKKMVIKDVCDCHFEDDSWSLPRKLLKLHRASPIAEIHLC